MRFEPFFLFKFQATMSTKQTPWYLITILFFFSCTSTRIPVTYTVTAPLSTDSVVVIGDRPELGDWDHQQAQTLKRLNDSTFQTTIVFHDSGLVEYKFTRGSWDKEALRPDKTIPSNEQYIITGPDTIFHSIPYWRDGTTVMQQDPFDGITGQYILHKQVYSPQLDNSRDILVWLPPSYHQDTSKHYPVLYLHDGQNVFMPYMSMSGDEWRLDETATKLIQSREVEEFIMVALYSLDATRRSEYSPTLGGEAYSQFIVETVKPMIDASYRTLPAAEHTAVMGSSMGGIISFHLLWEYPNVFSKAGCLSPAFLVANEEIVRRVADYRGPKKPGFFVIYNGTEDLDAELQPAIDHMMRELKNMPGGRSPSYIYKTFPGHSHTEADWARQAESILQMFFGAPVKSRTTSK